MDDPNSFMIGNVQSLLLLVHYSHSAINTTETALRKHANISIMIRQKKLKLQNSCCAMMSQPPFIAW